MKRLFLISFLILFFISDAVPVFRTDFSMTIYIKNKSDQWKRIFLEKGRILEIAKINSSHIQSIILTGGEGWIAVPPGETVQRNISGICLQKGLKFPNQATEIIVIPFTGSAELIAAGSDQESIHKITEFPRDNISVIVSKGYSDDNKDGRAADKEEAFKAAVENAARESGFTFSSETILENLRLIQTNQRIKVEEKSIKLLKVVHEEYNDETGEYLYIGEFEVRSKPSRPELK